MAETKETQSEKPPEETRKPAPFPESVSELSEEERQKYGYAIYPDRNEERPYTLSNIIFHKKDTEEVDRKKCQKSVYKAFSKSPMLKILVKALKKQGCPFDYARHISCEYCTPIVTGGYDPIQNQVVVCQNMCWSSGLVHSVLFHEMLHMYDNCVHNVDFQNPEHIACTEIRAANLTYCSYMSAAFGGHIPSWTLKGMQRECVKKRAVDSLLAVRDITLEEAEAVVKKVFRRCYYDTEPIGRTIRRNSDDHNLAYSEAFLYGFE